ncbi:MAG TPA: hypothetical protein VFA80_00690 [Xanthobacteraceae bacterium]|nr:hypothetical protein [Xanthobacteraceae bacterium]
MTLTSTPYFIIDQTVKTWRRPRRVLFIVGWLLPARAVYAGSFIALLAASFLAMSGRALFASLAAVAIAQGVIQVSRLKHKHMNMYLHAYDFVFFLRPASLRFALDNVTSVTLQFTLGFAALTVLLVAAYLLDPTRVPRLYAVVAMPVYSPSWPWQSAVSRRVNCGCSSTIPIVWSIFSIQFLKRSTHVCAVASLPPRIPLWTITWRLAH